MAGLAASERRRVPAGAEAPPASRPNSVPLCTARTRGPLQLGEQSRGRRRESRAARPAGGALGLRAQFGARLGLRGARERGLLRSPSPAHCSAGPGPAGLGQGSKSGRRPSPGRRTPGDSETSCRCFCFLLKTASWTRGGCFPNPRARRGGPGGGGGGGGGRGPASGAFPATCQFYCCRASVSHFASPLAAVRSLDAQTSLTRPSRPPALAGPRAETRGRGRRGGKGDRFANLRERRRVAGVAALLRAVARNAWIHGPGTGSRLSRPLLLRRG